MRQGKSTGHSAVSVEVIQAIPFEPTWGLHRALSNFYNSEEMSPADWRWVKLMLLTKQRVPKQWDQYRGICLLNVLSKLCMGGAMEIARRWTQEVLGPRWNEPMLFGFERGFQCEDVLGILQGLVDEAVEWGEARPLVAINTDVKQAFDFVRPEVVARCMRYWAFPPKVIHAVVRESLHLQGSAVVPGVGASDPFRMGSCKRQGGVEGPWCFNLVIRTALDMLRTKWHSVGIEAR